MHNRASDPHNLQLVQIHCSDLPATLDFYEQLGFALERIRPADAPHYAALTGDGIRLELHCPFQPAALSNRFSPGPQLSRNSEHSPWVLGRAGMHYRDLLPGRFGGQIIASHIRIAEGGPVPDYVHYHHVGFQLIYCHRGWVKVLYEDQGEAFVLQPGDAVLQPPTIRHRVLEASDGLEVIELSSPAEHDTWREHRLNLPNAQGSRERLYGGQRFVRFQGNATPWQSGMDGTRWQNLGMHAASAGAGDVQRAQLPQGSRWQTQTGSAEVLFMLVLSGSAMLDNHGAHALASGDAALICPMQSAAVQAESVCELLLVRLAV